MRHLPIIHYSLSFSQTQTSVVSFLLPASSFLDELFLLQQSLYQHFPFVQKRGRYACKTQMVSIFTNCSWDVSLLLVLIPPMCPYKVCAFSVPTSLIPDVFSPLLDSNQARNLIGWRNKEKKKHIQFIICKSSFCRHNIAIMYFNTVINMQKVFTDSCADPSAKRGLSSLFMQYITHNDFVPFSTFHTVHCSLIFQHKQTNF